VQPALGAVPDFAWRTDEPTQRLSHVLGGVSAACPASEERIRLIESHRTDICHETSYRRTFVPPALSGCEGWSVTLTEEHRLRVAEAKQEETGDISILRNFIISDLS
jgi:hypothetical protein